MDVIVPGEKDSRKVHKIIGKTQKRTLTFLPESGILISVLKY